MEARETRSRGKRQQPPPEPADDVPITKRRAAPGRKPARPAQPATETEEGHEEDLDGSHLNSSDERAIFLASRRGAPPPVDAESLTSVNVREANQDAETENGQDDIGASQELPQIEEEGDDEDWDIKLQVMAASLGDLSRTADGLIHQLRSPKRGSKACRQLLEFKRKYFATTREIYLDSSESSFIDWTKLGDLRDYDTGGVSPQPALECANIASALDTIERIQSGSDPVLGRLSDLDGFLHKLFSAFGDEAESVGLALDLRTIHLLEKLPARPTLEQVRREIASTFYEPDSVVDNYKDFANFMVEAPLKPLIRGGTDISQVCTDRLHEVMKDIKPKGARGDPAQLQKDTKTLKARYPLADTLDLAKQQIWNVYDSSKRARENTQSGSRETFYDAPESTSAEETSSVESQPIVRATGPQQQSLFQDAASLDTLNKSAPLSNQQQHQGVTPGPPADYVQHSNEMLLGPPVSGFSGSSHSPRPPRITSQRVPNDPFVKDGDDDEDDNFEQDSRSVNKEKAAAIAHALQTQRTPHPGPSSSMASPIPSRARANITTPPSSALSAPQPPPTSSMDALRQGKRNVKQQARATARPAFRQRHAWSDHDTELLIRLTAEHHAAWSIIESSYGGQFEQPRNQQAYRDKARNLKVDFLMTDCLLPSRFDLVALGKKEVDRLVSHGKNPYRRESDVEVDEDGYAKAINTEYEPPQGSGQ